MPQMTEAYGFDWSIPNIPQITMANTSMPQIFVAYMSMTSFENGRNQIIISNDINDASYTWC